MPTSIMGGPTVVTVDVRDMLCAQALAVVARAAGPLRPGVPLQVLFNADDVRQDLLVWAQGRGMRVSEDAPGTLRLAQPAGG